MGGSGHQLHLSSCSCFPGPLRARCLLASARPLMPLFGWWTSSPLFVSPSRPGEPPCGYSPSLWLFRSAFYYSDPRCVEWERPPCTHVPFETHKKVQSAIEWSMRREESAINACAGAAPERTGSFCPTPLLSTLCVLCLLTRPGSRPPKVRSPFHGRPLGTPSSFLPTVFGLIEELEE